MVHYYAMPGLKRNLMTGIRPKQDPPDSPLRDMENIIAIVLNKKNLTEESLITKSRRRELVYARQLCMYLVHKYSRVTLRTIGERLGGRDHTTVIHSKQTVMDLMYTDPVIKQEVEDLQFMIIG